MKSLRPIRSKIGTIAVAGLSVLALAACTGNDSNDDKADLGGGTSQADNGSNDEAGDKVVIGFSAPAADHGWMGSITQSAQDVADEYDDVELKVAEGTNDVNVQISQVETFINQGVDAIVLLPFDGAAMTPIALEAMSKGIPVINVDREFDDPNAARVTVLGDNYGMGVSAGQWACEQVGDNPDAVIAEIAGRDEFAMIGGAGSANAMREIQSGDSVLKATVIYPSTQAADGIKLARLLVQGKSMSDLVEVEVPRTVQLYAPVVTADNVDDFIDTAFES